YFSTAVKIDNNVIHDIGLQTSDAGGVYVWNTDTRGTEVAYNLIYNARGGGFGNTGIFLDNNVHNELVHHNVVWNTDTALKMNPAVHYDRIFNNTLLGSASLNTSGNRDMAGCVLANNILASAWVFGNGSTQT